MVDEINDKLSEYAEFDIKELLDLSNDRYIRIFGGSIRDIIARKEIHDIDVVIGPDSMEHCINVLKNNGYRYNNKLCTKDWNALYSKISIINEPHTWIKGDKIIQLIRPSKGGSLGGYKEDFLNVLQSVDILCCGVSFDGKYLYENKEYAINECLTHKITKCVKSSMYNNVRTEMRVYKLESRGWSVFGMSDRLKKLNQILDKKISFVKEYKANKRENNYINRNKEIW